VIAQKTAAIEEKTTSLWNVAKRRICKKLSYPFDLDRKRSKYISMMCLKAEIHKRARKT
jgi:hypothetical protein